ncbi:MAG: nicotinamide mononucleotide transporter [Bryobacterales bacterium]|jgi:nicotinamide mononucleotide transporter|nr:nicotinamide mononucleotide transporter [Bryobacterales bacterium]
MPLSLTEVLGFITGALCVWLLARQNIWTWPIGIGNNLFFLVLFLRTGLYADGVLQIIYVALAAYGWWTWLYRKTPAAELPVTHARAGTWLWLAPATGMTAAILWFTLARFTDSIVPGWDSLTTAISLAAIWGQCRKLLESWYLWILADLVYIPLYIYKGLRLTAALYVVFLVLCLMGLKAWREALRPVESLP